MSLFFLYFVAAFHTIDWHLNKTAYWAKFLPLFFFNMRKSPKQIWLRALGKSSLSIRAKGNPTIALTFSHMQRSASTILLLFFVCLFVIFLRIVCVFIEKNLNSDWNSNHAGKIKKGENLCERSMLRCCRTFFLNFDVLKNRVIPISIRLMNNSNIFY